ncbi:hypothetical protein PQ469_17320 [Mucilaginibacter sp. KACC 22773]|uniref:hypothetical protein n=1 Tax=Mucilaginibacter sp. KACC 22773 TaxID=3025671 RepID=UPI0023668995|nr:hypothetical protein [Mucilaginibacter sp. KACC 22773]WDF75647.1 hypothetical protein PQ469_17320 [Mucilaginibacter sp. KACC 22773]
MTRSDQIIHRFSIYEIKRHTYEPYVFRWTNFYENYSIFLQRYPVIQLDLAEDELIICSTVIDADNYSLLTTRRIVTKENGTEDIADLVGVKQNTPPLQFKLEKYNYVSGTLQLPNKNVFRYFIEAGKACMVMEYGIRTLIWSQQLTDSQMINLMRLWDKRFKS